MGDVPHFVVADRGRGLATIRLYRNLEDAACGAAVLVSIVCCSLMLVASVAYYWQIRDYLYLFFWWQFVFREGLLLSTVVAGVRFRATLLRQTPTSGDYALTLGALAVGCWAAFAWFSWPMHDIALEFGGHGRWGSHELAPNGREFFLRDKTVPLLLFGPVIGIVTTHWARSRRINQEPPNRPSSRPAPPAADGQPSTGPRKM